MDIVLKNVKLSAGVKHKKKTTGFVNKEPNEQEKEQIIKQFEDFFDKIYGLDTEDFTKKEIEKIFDLLFIHKDEDNFWVINFEELEVK